MSININKIKSFSVDKLSYLLIKKYRSNKLFLRAEEEYLDEILELFNYAEGAYKRLQPYICSVDNQIQNEYRYTARAAVKILQLRKDGSYKNKYRISTPKKRFLDDFHSSVKHIINDTIDYMSLIAMQRINDIESRFNKSPIISIYGNFGNVVRAIGYVNKEIAKSRELGGIERVRRYKELYKSNELETIITFLDDLPLIYSLSKEGQIQKVSEGIRTFSAIVISIGILTFSALTYFEIRIPVFYFGAGGLFLLLMLVLYDTRVSRTDTYKALSNKALSNKALDNNQ